MWRLILIAQLSMNCRKIRFFGVFLLFSAVFSGFGSVSFAGEDYSFENIEVGAESKSPARSRVKAFSKARKEALRQLFAKLKVNIDVNDVKNADALAIFGPAETYLKFQKELLENYLEIGKKIKEVRNEDSMTKNQTIALVRDFYNS